VVGGGVNEESLSWKQRLRYTIQTRAQILVPVLIALTFGCFFCGLRAVRFFRHFPMGQCFTNAQPGDTIYPVTPWSSPETASDVPLGMIELPQSTERFGSVCLFWQGGTTDIWFEMHDDELDEFLASHSIDSLSESAPTVPGFGPTLWQRGQADYRYADFDYERNQAYVHSQIWVDDRPNNTTRIYIRLLYGD
jgi:hypothetical protein